MKFTTKLIAALFAVALVASMAVATSAFADDVVILPLSGDVDGNGVVAMGDVVDTQKHIAKLKEFDEAKFTLADVSEPFGEITMTDVTSLQKYIAKLIEKFPVDDVVSSDIIDTDTTTDTTTDGTSETTTDTTTDIVSDTDTSLDEALSALKENIDIIKEVGEDTNEEGLYFDDEYAEFKALYDEAVKAYESNGEGYTEDELYDLADELMDVWYNLEYTPYATVRFYVEDIKHMGDDSNDLGKYTDDTYAVFIEVYERAIAYLADKTTLTDEEVINLYDELDTAYFNLTLTPFGHLYSLVEEIKDHGDDTNDNEYYYEDLYEVFAEFYAKALAYLEDRTLLTDEEVSELCNELNDAWSSLEYTAYGKISLLVENIIDNGDDTNDNGYYTAESYDAFYAMYIKVLPYLDDTSTFTDEYANELFDMLYEAWINLEYTTYKNIWDLVDAIISCGDDENDGEYSEESYNAFYELFEKAVAYLDDTSSLTEEQAQKLYDDLGMAWMNLEGTPYNEISSFVQMIKDFEEDTNDNGYYTTESYEAFYAIYEQALAYLEDDTSLTEEEAQKLCDDLENAYDSLEYSTHYNLSSLVEVIMMEGLNSNESKLYTEETYSVFYPLYEQALAYLEDTSLLTDEELEKLYADISVALENLELTPYGNFRAVVSAIQFTGIDLQNPGYTEETYSAFKTVYEKAVEEIMNPQLTDEELTALSAELEATVEALKYTRTKSLELMLEYVSSFEIPEDEEFKDSTYYIDLVNAYNQLVNCNREPDTFTDTELSDTVMAFEEALFNFLAEVLGMM